MTDWKPVRFEHDLSPAEVEEIAPELRTLVNLPGWTVFAELVEATVRQARAVGFDDLPNVTYWKGFVDGLLKAKGLPVGMLELAHGQLKDERVRDRVKRKREMPLGAGDALSPF